MVSALQHLWDFANLFKAFIGSNYLSMSFAFRESGFALGITLLVAIAILTDHCCHLIVTCKQLMVESICEEAEAAADADDDAAAPAEPFYDSGSFDHQAVDEQSEEPGGRSPADDLHKTVTLGDIAKFTYGRFGLYLVNASLFVTQFGFCINYFIFIGNTLHRMLSISQNDTDAVIINSTLDSIEWSSSALSSPPSWWSPPPLLLLVAAPLPLFLGFSLIRNIRSMGSVSMVANLSICAGVVAVLVVMLLQFEPSPSVAQARISTLPVYIGIVAVSYEGIGTIIPIQSSMEGNRHNFRIFLRGALLAVTAILGGVGAVGYLRYGADSKQILVQNLPTDSLFVVILDATLIFGVIFTFPLQIFPVIQMMENLCLAKYSAAPEEHESLISSASSVQVADAAAASASDADAIHAGSSAPDFAPTWLRNCIRFAIVFCQLAMAMLLRNLYAYVSSFIGAVGSIFLAFILPCAAHLRLVRRCRPAGYRYIWLVVAKDACICCLGCLASVTSLFVTVVSIVEPNFF